MVTDMRTVQKQGRDENTQVDYPTLEDNHGKERQEDDPAPDAYTADGSLLVFLAREKKAIKYEFCDLTRVQHSCTVHKCCMLELPDPLH